VLIDELNNKSAQLSNVFESHTGCQLYTFINSYSYLRIRESNFANFSFDGYFYDGIIMKMFINLFLNKSISRISFDMTSLAPIIFKDSIKKNKNIYFIGSTEIEINGFIKTIKSNYADLDIVGYRHGYFSDHEREESLNKINNINPDIVIVGMGSPLQENFLLDLKKTGWEGIGFTCGGFIHQTSKGLLYYPAWIDKTNLRWLYRLYDEPKLIKRFLGSYFIFPFIFIWDFCRYSFFN
jgi:N-acetylglucosaminyldiphosphoundecaprenol N-acetyl-beta-D-mannosaminyltransferase